MKLKKTLNVFAFIFFFFAGHANAGLEEAEAAYKGRDYTKAFKEYKQLAEQGNAFAQSKLADMYYKGEGVKKNFEKARLMYKSAAEQGNANASYELFKIYNEGLGVEVDKQQAEKWLQKAGDLEGIIGSMAYIVADIYYKGDQVEQDLKKAEIYYRKAAEQNFPAAITRLASMYWGADGFEQDRKEAEKWLLKSAEMNVVSAQKILAQAYFFGDQSLDKNYKEATKWLRKAGENGDAYSQELLGHAYYKGNGVVQSYSQAAEWYRKAAEQDYHSSQRSLGNLYLHGRGVDKDYNKAHFWFKKAAPHDDWARNNLKLVNCFLEEGTHLFDINLRCADRKMMRKQVKAAGGVAKRESYDYWGDVYSSESLLNGSSELVISYDADNKRVALVQYEFPSHMDSQQVAKIRDMVASKYGSPSHSSGTPKLGNVTYRWKLSDGIELKVARGWPDTTTYLSFKDPQIFSAQQAEIKRQKEDRQKNNYQEQQSNF